MSGVQTLFAELSDRLASVEVSAQLFVVGGAAMTLAYDHHRLTRDVDALFVPGPEGGSGARIHRGPCRDAERETSLLDRVSFSGELRT